MDINYIPTAIKVSHSYILHNGYGYFSVKNVLEWINLESLPDFCYDIDLNWVTLNQFPSWKYKTMIDLMVEKIIISLYPNSEFTEFFKRYGVFSERSITKNFGLDPKLIKNAKEMTLIIAPKHVDDLFNNQINC